MNKIMLLLCLGLLGSACAQAEPAAPPDLLDFGAMQLLEIVHGDQRISLSVELADDPVERAQGLMYRSAMGGNVGMLFDFEQNAVVNMWMKNTLIPLDMIFMDKTGKIITIARNTKPHSLRRVSSGVAVTSVLEVNAGLCRKWNLGRGDQVYHALFGNAPLDKEQKNNN